VVADELCVPLETIVVRAQDTDASPVSTAGTRASRTAVVTGGALALAARDLRERVRAVAAHRLGRPAETLELRDGRIVDADGGDAGLDLRAVAETAYFDPTVRAVVPEPELSVTRFYDPPATYSSGCIACVAEVDPGTGRARVLRLAAIEDCGTIINPTIVEGQLLGALTQGVGMALFESAGYDADGRPTARTLTDYRLPRTTDVPEPRLGHRESPSPWTVNGVKGMGESGAIAAPAAVACAVADALATLGAAVERTPLTPVAILTAIREGRADPSPGSGAGSGGPGGTGP
jgi:carbon-monoxide dehydrogenase large subunit